MVEGIALLFDESLPVHLSIYKNNRAKSMRVDDDDVDNAADDDEHRHRYLLSSIALI